MQKLPINLLILLLAVTACSSRRYQQAADREVYRAIESKAPAVPNMDTEFTIDQESAEVLASLPQNDQTVDFFGPNNELEIGASIISLEQALKIATQKNRTYQNQREILYLQALGLTLSRFQYTPIFSARGSGDLTSRKTNVSPEDIENDIDRLTREEEVTVSGDANASWLLRTGGRLTAAFTTDFLRFVAGDRTLTTSSRLSTTLSQPLLRGAGYRNAMENLTQSERNLLYSLRDFVRFRKEFTVDLVSEYYRVLQSRDRVRNAWLGYQNFQASVRREQARFEIGEARKADLAQLQESQLTNEQTWVSAQRNYREGLDRFKITLGLPTNAQIILDESELKQLQIDETHLNLTLPKAVEVALASRQDYQTVLDQVEDAERKVRVASNGLLPDIDFILGASVNNRPGQTRVDLDPERLNWNAGLDVELPLNRKSERNRFRSTLISYERAKRNKENSTDQIRLQIQNSWRNLDQAKRNHEISQLRVQLSRSRVREQELLHETGDGDAFQSVQAQEALTSSLNQLTAALVNHTLLRLSFWRDLGLFFVTPEGNWQDLAYDQTP